MRKTLYINGIAMCGQVGDDVSLDKKSCTFNTQDIKKAYYDLTKKDAEGRDFSLLPTKWHLVDDSGIYEVIEPNSWFFSF